MNLSIDEGFELLTKFDARWDIGLVKIASDLVKSLISILFCIIIWIPNLFFQIASPFWLLSFIIAPIGVALAYKGKSKILIFVNIIMFFSFFLLMFLGYFINDITS